ncbi:MAG: transporter substrate-binding domain-containing protein [Rhodospirillaceae bacterium]|nr:transporter substrate-binding domain-containing protein [Rhodospirillales bacterium]
MKHLIALIAILLAPLAANAAEVTIAVGRSLPPYVIVDEWRGLEYDVVREALALEGHTLKPRYMAIARVMKELDTGLVDAAMTMQPSSGVKAFYSDSHITYRNYAITLAKHNFTIKRPEDLAGKSVIAFQKATVILGPAFKAAVESNPRYREEVKQVVQPTLLFLDRVDVVVSERSIFGWFANEDEVKSKVDTTQAVRFHPIFPPTDYYVAFRDEALRDSFNRGLKKLRASGMYGKIIERYSGFLKEDGGG